MIQACSSQTLSSIDARCENSFGGIKRILIANRDSVDVSAATGTSAMDQVIIALKTGATTPFVEWKFRRNTGAYTSTATLDPAVGTKLFTTELTLQFTKAEAEKRMKIENALAANAVVIIEDAYGQYVYLGYDQEVNFTAAVMQSGTANSDLSGFTLTLQDISKQLPYFIAMTEAEINALMTV